MRPPPPSGSIARPPGTSSTLVSTARPSTSGPNSGAVNETGASSRPAAISLTTARPPTTGHNIKVNGGPVTPPFSVPTGGQRVSVPPTPGPSPTAPTSGTKVRAPQARPAAPGPTSPPKTSRGLGASRWAADESQAKPTAECRAQAFDQAPDLRANAPDTTDDPATSQTTEGQATPQDTPSEIQIHEATQALSKLRITDNTTAKAELIDPLTGDELEPGFVVFAKAQLLIDEPVEKKFCVLYLGARDQDCPVFEVAFHKEPMVSHNLLDLLSHSHCGVFMDVTFRSGPNDIMRYNFELETGRRVGLFLRALQLLRELTVDALFEDLSDLDQASASAILAKKSASRRGTSSPARVVIVTYPFSLPTTKKCSPKSTSTAQEALIPPLPKSNSPGPITTAQAALIPPARQSYTPEHLLSLRREEVNQPNPLADVDFIRAVKRGVHKRTDSEECVVGTNKPFSGGMSIPTDEKSPLVVLGEVRRTVAAGRDWVSRNGEVGL